MSASTSALPPPECVTCKIPLQLKKDQDGNLRLLQSYICGRCGDEYPPKLTAEEEALRSEEERRRRQAQPSLESIRIVRIVAMTVLHMRRLLITEEKIGTFTSAPAAKKHRLISIGDVSFGL
nr:hypothetical protein Iba_chr03dCG8480 [Ipomoea batatas]